MIGSCLTLTSPSSKTCSVGNFQCQAPGACHQAFIKLSATSSDTSAWAIFEQSACLSLVRHEALLYNI